MHRLLFFICIGIFSIPICVRAQLNITEIMYDPAGTDAGHEWIEIYNTGTSPITVTEWKFLENAVNHGIVEHRGGTTLPAGAYGIIADNPANVLADIPMYTGIIFDSAFSLNNTGEALALVDDTGATVDSVTYSALDGIGGTGASLQKTSQNIWQGALATPGSTFIATGSGNSGSGSGGNTGSGTIDTGNSGTTGSSGSGTSGGGTTTGDVGTSGTVTTTGGITGTTNTSGPMGSNKSAKDKPKDYYDPYYTGTLKIPNHILAGVAIPFELELIYHVYDHEPTKRKSGRFVWNMGDGTEYTQYAVPHIEHLYEDAGVYILVLDFFTSPEFFQDNPALHFEVKVTVDSSDIQIIGVDTDGTIMLANGLDVALNISNWKIEYGGTAFTFPHNSFISEKETLSLGVLRTKFAMLVGDEHASLVLKYPDGTVHSSFKKTPTLRYSDGEGDEESGNQVVIDREISDKGGDNSLERSDLAASVIAATPLDIKTNAIPTWLWGIIAGSIVLSALGITASFLWGHRESLKELSIEAFSSQDREENQIKE